MARALSRVRWLAATSRLGAEKLAHELAVACGPEGRSPEEVLHEPADVAPLAVVELAERMLAPENRTIVTLNPKP
jgi:predicted Zn-dependent peptidase